jgi:hypothetical protein
MQNDDRSMRRIVEFLDDDEWALSAMRGEAAITNERGEYVAGIRREGLADEGELEWRERRYAELMSEVLGDERVVRLSKECRFIFRDGKWAG